MYKDCSCFSDAIHTMSEDDTWIFFTIGNGRARYHFWTCSPSGFYYVYRCGKDGHAIAKRQIEEKTKIKVFYSDR